MSNPEQVTEAKKLSEQERVKIAGEFYMKILEIPMTYYEYAKQGKKFKEDSKYALYSLAMIIHNVNQSLGQSLEADNPDEFAMIKSFVWDWDTRKKTKAESCDLLSGFDKLTEWAKDLVISKHQDVVKGGKITPEATEILSRVCRAFKLLNEVIPFKLDKAVERDNQFGSAMEYFLPLNKN